MIFGPLHCLILLWRVFISEINRSPSMNAKPFSIERLVQSIKSISLKLQLKLKAVLILPFPFSCSFEIIWNTSHVKQPLVSETFNIVGLHPPHGLVSENQVILNILKRLKSIVIKSPTIPGRFKGPAGDRKCGWSALKPDSRTSHLFQVVDRERLGEAKGPQQGEGVQQEEGLQGERSPQRVWGKRTPKYKSN